MRLSRAGAPRGARSCEARATAGSAATPRPRPHAASRSSHQQEQLPQATSVAPPSRRGLLLGLAAAGLLPRRALAAEPGLLPAVLDLSAAPDQSRYDPADPDLRDAAALLQRALNAETVAEEEALWTQVINKYQGVNAVWGPDVVGRALGNRGNARSRQGKLDAALADYNAAMALCPWSVDPVINRGVALEALGRWEEAAADYRAVIAVAPEDPVPYNNLGNTMAGMGRWAEAEANFGKAAALAPSFSFAAANRALALYQLGSRDQAMREFRGLLRRFPDFPDMRAALAAALWAAGKEGDAESQWARVEDPRYRDVAWLARERRWPPALTDAMAAFLQLRSL